MLKTHTNPSDRNRGQCRAACAPKTPSNSRLQGQGVIDGSAPEGPISAPRAEKNLALKGPAPGHAKSGKRAVEQARERAAQAARAASTKPRKPFRISGSKANAQRQRINDRLGRKPSVAQQEARAKAKGDPIVLRKKPGRILAMASPAWQTNNFPPSESDRLTRFQNDAAHQEQMRKAERNFQ